MPEETFHTRLRAAIEARGTTVTAVAAHLSISRFTVNRWLKSQMPDADQISRLAAYLNVSVDHLQRGSEIDHEHMMRCQILFALSTDLQTSHVNAMIALAEGLLATKM